MTQPAESDPRAVRVGVLWPGDPAEPPPAPEEARLSGVFAALAARGVAAEPVVYADAAADAVREQLLALDGVLVWVNPIFDGHDRSRLDALLRDVASQGVWVSAHPDVILKMGTKDVLVRTRDASWGSACFLYRTLDELRDALPARLAAGPRVLKQHRGASGDGVWKVERDPAAPAGDRVRVLHAQRGSSLEDLTFDALLARLAPYFEGAGCVIDQPYQERLGDGMVRCYLSRDRVVGFGHQMVTALLPPPPGTRESPAPPPRLYYGPGKPEFQELKRLVESSWVGELERLVDVERDDLPAIWDADFLYGPRTADGADTYVLCEINVSSVFPIPDEAFAPIADVVVKTLGERRA